MSTPLWTGARSEGATVLQIDLALPATTEPPQLLPVPRETKLIIELKLRGARKPCPVSGEALPRNPAFADVARREGPLRDTIAATSAAAA